MTCAYEEWDGAYVLGSLSPTERLEFERHLATCDACSRSVRDLAGLPGLLARVDPDVLAGDPPAVVPATVLPALLRRVRRARRRRWVVVAAGTAAAAVLATTVALTRDDAPAPPTGPAQQAMQPAADAPVRATVALDAVGWGTRIDLTCTYGAQEDGYDLPSRMTYALVVHTSDGRTEQLGTWSSARAKTMHFTAGTALPRDDIRDVEVQTLSGRTVLSLEG